MFAKIREGGVATYDSPTFIETNTDSIVSELRNGMTGAGYSPAADIKDGSGPPFRFYGTSAAAPHAAGVAALAVVWARELARHGIRVGAIAPGFTHTGILDAMKPEMLEKMVAPVPVGRLGRPEEIAHAARFIFENDFYTGRVLELDGGLRL